MKNRIYHIHTTISDNISVNLFEINYNKSNLEEYDKLDYDIC